MNPNPRFQENNENEDSASWEMIEKDSCVDDDNYEPYESEEDLPPYSPGEAYQSYCEDPTYDNAIEAADEIWGIPDPRLIGLD